MNPRPAAPSGRGPRDRGAVLVHVAVATMGLLAFSALSIDLGTLWVARGQAQNAADAAALSGAVSLAYIDESDTAAAQAAATAVAQQHAVWGAGVVPAEVTTTIGACPAGSPGVPGTCMGVTVARNTSSGTPLPVFFARMFGATGNDMHASASAKVMLGNRTSCPRPLAIADRWNDHNDTTAPVDALWTFDDTFDRYSPAGTPLGGSVDVYDPPSGSGSGSGWALSQIRPSPRVTFRVIVTVDPLAPLAANQMISLDLQRPGGAANAYDRYSENLETCGADPLRVGQTVETVAPHRERYTVVPLGTLIDSDSGAYWDDGVQAVRGSSQPVSPRVITIAIIDPDQWSQQNRTVNPPTGLLVRNLAGFFVEGVQGLGTEVHVTGRLMRTAGMFTGDAPALPEQSAFLRTVALVR